MWFESQKCLCHFIFIEIQNCLRKGAFSFIYPRKFPLTDELHNYVWEYRWSFRQTQSWCCLALDNIISWVLTSPPPLPSLNTPSILGSRAGLIGGESVGVKGTGTGERRAGKNWFSNGPCRAVCSPALCERVLFTERLSVWENLQFSCRSLLLKSNTPQAIHRLTFYSCLNMKELYTICTE